MMTKRTMQQEDFEVVAYRAYELCNVWFGDNPAKEMPPMLLAINVDQNHLIADLQVTIVNYFFTQEAGVRGKDIVAATMRKLVEVADLVVLVSEAWLGREEDSKPGVEVRDMLDKREAVIACIQSADASHIAFFDIDRTTNTLKYRPINFSGKLTGRFAGKERTPC